jgi:hypothetical protein
MIRLSKESPAHLRGGGISISGGIGDSTTNSGGVAQKLPQETPVDQGTTQKPPTAPMLTSKLSTNIAAAYNRGQAKRDELRRQYGLEAESAKKALDFDDEIEDVVDKDTSDAAMLQIMGGMTADLISALDPDTPATINMFWDKISALMPGLRCTATSPVFNIPSAKTLMLLAHPPKHQ